VTPKPTLAPNPALSRLGFSSSERVLIIHVDDVGMFQSTVSVLPELYAAGIVTSASAMVPCPWFGAAARVCAANPRFDVGIHLTLTSEWPDFRWRPLTGPQPGLTGEDGTFCRSSEELFASIDATRAHAELRAQIAWARSSGLQPTHLDSHMMTLWGPSLMPTYAQLAIDEKLPLLFLRRSAEAWVARGHPREVGVAAEQTARRLESAGFPLFDKMVMLPLDRVEDRVAQAIALIDELPTGLSMLLAHPAADSPELRAGAADWAARVADFQALTSPRLAAYLKQSGIHCVGYRALQALVPT
jgi:predicted glycoside hydrolase/deacetylase ChbG (UPF0249 family)